MKPLKGLHTEGSDELRELASLYSLGALTEEEKAVYEAHLGAGCAICASEVASFRKVTGTIGMGLDPVSPRAELRERLMNAIVRTLQPHDRQAPGVIYDKDGVLIARPLEMDWQAAELSGIFQKVLFNDTARGFSTSMVRMTPGTHYPRHKHAGVEELYLLEGDLCPAEDRFEGDLVPWCRPSTTITPLGVECQQQSERPLYLPFDGHARVT
ncbi:MAG TPA: cupin domain-containing protein, partial [Candidatus Acidoferrum sp.]|nr:cupin domain-containing protein [Candidatus Acidoferrum sp.]